MDVDGQGLQGAQVHDACDALDVLAGLVRVIESVDGGEESGERLARAGRSADQRVPPGGDRGPASGLGLGWPVRESSLEPGADGGVKAVEYRGSDGDGRRR